MAESGTFCSSYAPGTLPASIPRPRHRPPARPGTDEPDDRLSGYRHLYPLPPGRIFRARALPSVKVIKQPGKHPKKPQSGVKARLSEPTTQKIVPDEYTFAPGATSFGYFYYLCYVNTDTKMRPAHPADSLEIPPVPDPSRRDSGVSAAELENGNAAGTSSYGYYSKPKPTNK